MLAMFIINSKFITKKAHMKCKANEIPNYLGRTSEQNNLPSRVASLTKKCFNLSYIMYTVFITCTYNIYSYAIGTIDILELCFVHILNT